MLLRLTPWLLTVFALTACDERAVSGDEGEAEAEAESEAEAEAEGEGEPAIDAALPDLGPPDAGCSCIELYAPVCGIDGITYDNICFAECAGVVVACANSVCPCPEGCGECTSDSDCYPGQYCNAADVCLTSCDCPACGVCAGRCIAATTCALMECEAGYGCRCGGAGPGPHLCQCGLDCDDETDCTDPGQDVCCDGTCTDACTCHCR